MNRQLSLLGGVGMGIGLGAGLMYLIDPEQGRRRRSVMRDQVVRSVNQLGHGLVAGSRDLRHRAKGFISETLGSVRAADIDDSILCDRVRSKIGRHVSHPGAIMVEARQGRVTLRGPILAHEVECLINCVRQVRGVRDIENSLSVHDKPGRIPSLQGAGRRPGEHWNLLENNWAPGTRLLMASIGGGLVGYGTTQRFPLACIIGTIGLALIGRAAMNRQLTTLMPKLPKVAAGSSDGHARVATSDPWQSRAMGLIQGNELLTL